MNLGRQWDERLKIWDEALAGEILPCIATFDTEGFTTMEKLSFSQAKTKPFKKIPTGTKWGKKWEYGWAHAIITVPAQYRKERIWVRLGSGPEMLVFVNGMETGSIDRQHEWIMINKVPRNGILDIYAEVYAGHGARVESAGLVRRDAEPLPPVPAKQVKTTENIYGFIDREITSVYYDYHVLYEILKQLPDTSVRAGRIFTALKAFTEQTFPEEDAATRRESFIRAHDLLKPLMEEKNGTDCPEYTVFGQSHIDLAWLWTHAETRRKTARTFSNQLTLMEAYDDHRFLLCEPVLFEWLKEDYPALYERVKKAVSDGKLIPEGGMYVESDVNMAGAECLVRQFVYGRRMFRDEFGTESVLAWMPDTFGYSGALPQIMKKCGIKYFTTQKLMRQDPEYEPFPYNDFVWEGIDGSKILSHIYKKNNCALSVADLCNRWKNDRLEYGSSDGMLFPFGYGDGGGGPTMNMLEILGRCKDISGVPKCRIESPVRYFERLAEKGTENSYYGELYLAWHRGTLTSQSEIKKLVRSAEIKLRETEFLCAFARILKESKPSEEEKLTALYKRLLVNEFHDVLPGTSIERVNRETREDLNDIIRQASGLAENILVRLAGENAVFNSLSWERRYKGVTLPPCGFVTLGKGKNSEKLLSQNIQEEKITAAELNQGNARILKIENAFYTACINENGEITSLVDAKTGFEYVKEPFNRFALYENVNGEYDAWELCENYEKMPVRLKGECTFNVRRIGRKINVAVTRKEEHFEVEQLIIFSCDSPVIDFETKINWHERHRILKTVFDTNIFTKEIISETQFGYIKRPTHRSRLYEKGMYEVAQHKYSAMTDGENGIALLNDSKYGISAKDGMMALTLLRAPVFPDPTADMGEHMFRYGLMLFGGPFTASGCVNAAYEYNIEPAGAMPDIDAAAKTTVSLFETDRKNIIIETCKPAFDVKNAVVLRIYESMGTACRCRLRFPKIIGSVKECNMLEDVQNEIEIEDNSAILRFGAFEVKTLMLSF